LPNLLLSTVWRPFGGKSEGDSVAELFHAQVTRGQGIFSYRQIIPCWGIDYIAENVAAPGVVLHYPSEREFLGEIKRTKYDYIGANFVFATYHKLRRMVTLIRKHTAQVIKEFEEFKNLGPSLRQILIRFAFPDTPLQRCRLRKGP